ncbi:hypothetical protein H0Z09_04975 [Pseudomonas sp. SWRI18]|uniref:hypothetical protein n=1 Tax=Pseudomonas TaxID=286 RepID=UPI001649000C|nr:MULTISPECIES: hypothetical protein [Pseudomonas]MBC3300467.1 hypothetical protein [Pseudomonas sp. SWRI18]MDQ0650852.1 hypothetical protein [Pseudomonas cedrina]
MTVSKALSYQALKIADSVYKKLDSLPLDAMKDEQDADLFLRLSMQATATNALFTENLRIEQLSLKTTIESFQ